MKKKMIKLSAADWARIGVDMGYMDRKTAQGFLGHLQDRFNAGSDVVRALIGSLDSLKKALTFGRQADGASISTILENANDVGLDPTSRGLKRKFIGDAVALDRAVEKFHMDLLESRVLLWGVKDDWNSGPDGRQRIRIDGDGGTPGGSPSPAAPPAAPQDRWWDR